MKLTALFTSVANLAEMVAVGLGLPAETFKDAGRYGLVLSLSTDI